MYAVSKTDIGRMRSTNQDVCCCGAFEDGSAWTVVCDGMGGVNGGNIASSIASETIVQCLQDAYAPGMDADAMRDMMLSAVQSANDAVIRRAEAEPDLYGMGTTAVVAIAAGSGITPIMALASEVLDRSPDARMTIVYANRSSTDVMFVDELADLKDRYPSRLTLHHVLSREQRAARLGGGHAQEAERNHHEQQRAEQVRPLERQDALAERPVRAHVEQREDEALVAGEPCDGAQGGPAATAMRAHARASLPLRISEAP